MSEISVKNKLLQRILLIVSAPAAGFHSTITVSMHFLGGGYFCSHNLKMVSLQHYQPTIRTSVDNSS